ncbi:hypothetical protein EVAR_35816_1 [Eumeta japonica]|uniref:Uncharacterized protein n=1 Tax=Eumeta variegata TaxID=151549 RepID=A0A4C1WY35_EUMVA|nr:hypothetical protein EVAR_35816_1 [Eumeta japonica]
MAVSYYTTEKALRATSIRALGRRRYEDGFIYLTTKAVPSTTRTFSLPPGPVLRLTTVVTNEMTMSATVVLRSSSELRQG